MKWTPHEHIFINGRCTCGRELPKPPQNRPEPEVDLAELVGYTGGEG